MSDPVAAHESRMLIGGQLVEGEAGTFANVNPATEAVIGEVSDATLDAAAARHPSAHSRQPASTGSPSDPPATDTGSKASPASSRVPTGEGS